MYFIKMINKNSQEETANTEDSSQPKENEANSILDIYRLNNKD